jgi:hypothetical protein
MLSVSLALSAGVDPQRVQAGYFGMAVVAALAVGTFLLLRSFRRQMRKMDSSELPHDRPRPHGPRSALRLPLTPAGPPRLGDGPHTAGPPLEQRPGVQHTDPGSPHSGPSTQT